MEFFGQELSQLELWGTLFGILGVLLTVQRNIYCFPAGLINVSLYAILFFRSRLYADTILQIFYIILLVYGWMQWSGKALQKGAAISTIPPKQWMLLLAVCAGSTMLIGTIFFRFTNASLPYVDSLLTSMSLVAQWMVAKKKIENWLVWIIADIAYVCMYVYKELYLTAALYFIFIVLAIGGYAAWKKKMIA